MDPLGKNKLKQQLRDKIDELRQWMYEHSSPDTPIKEFCEVANQHAILQTKLYIIEKQW